MPGGGHDLDDVAVAEMRAKRHHLSVDACADALMTNVGMHGVREVDRRRASRERFDLSLRGERVHLLRIQFDFQILDEFLRVADFLLVFEQLAHPLEVALVAMIPNAAFFVFPVRGDALFGHPVHLHRADLHFERLATLADHRRVQRLIPVRSRHRDEILDAAGHRRPGLVNDAERPVTVLDAVGDQPERDEVVHLVELDLLPLQLLMDAPQALDAAVHLHDRNLRLAKLGLDGSLEILNQPFGSAAFQIDLDAKGFVRLRLEIFERQLLELVLDLAHAEAVCDRRVDVAGFLRDAKPSLFRQVVERAHVVHAVRELDEDDADVVHHREQHLAEVLRLPLFGRRKRNGADLRDAFDDVRHVRAEQLADALDGRQRVLDHVVEQAGGDRHGVEAKVNQKLGDGERMDQVGFARSAHLSPVFEGRKDVGAAEQLEVGLRAVCADLLQKVLKTNHLMQFMRFRCLMLRILDVPFFASLYWPGFGHGKFLACISRAVLRGRNAICLGNITTAAGRGGVDNGHHRGGCRLRPGERPEGPQGV